MFPWLSIFALTVAGDAADMHRSSRVMRTTQRHETLEISGDAHFSLAEGERSTSNLGDGIGDAEEADLEVPSQHCSDMPSGFCCGLSPKKIRVETGENACACEGPESSGKFQTQEAIDHYCTEVVQPCNQLSHVVCCDMAPKMIRQHDGKDQCWCSGPQPNSTYSTQPAIDEWCASVVKPCSAMSEGHCCHMQPRQIRQGSGDKCWCSGPAVGSEFDTQAEIDAACSQVVKPCSSVSRESCCAMAPAQVRYNDRRNGCWCSGPVLGEAYSSQMMIDEWCGRVRGKTSSTTTTTKLTTTILTTTTTFTTTTTKTGRTTTTTSLSTLSCDEAMCCAMTPKRAMLRQIGNRCFCAELSSHPDLKSQEAVDAHCASVVKPCPQFRQEDCCQLTPAKYLVGDDIGVQTGVDPSQMCTCAGPLKASRYTEQEAIDSACGKLFTPCSELQEVHCCLSSPMRFRDGSGDRCFCSGPVAHGRFKSQEVIDERCSDELKSCDDLKVASCCAKTPKQVRVSDGMGGCWCSGPFRNGNTTYTQQVIEAKCASASTIQM
ncbi:unnamed protein product [Effrenium voratum]|nr:unnamed protein product [Effrenium voratum]